MTHENPNQDESPADEQETNNHARAIAAQLRLAEEETLEEIGADAEPHKFSDCPSCDGDLQYQNRSDALCLECGDLFSHEIRGERHLLWSFDDHGSLDEIVDRLDPADDHEPGFVRASELDEDDQEGSDK